MALPVGNYALADLIAQGIADNTISSVRGAPGFKAQAFANGDFTGASIIISGDTPALSVRGFDNKMSSVKITKIAVRATFYDLCGKQGYNVNLPLGNFNRTALASWGIGDNQISEVVPAGNTEVEIFDSASFDSNITPGALVRSRLITEK